MNTINSVIMTASCSNYIAHLLCYSIICVNFRLPRKFTNSNSGSLGGTQYVEDVDRNGLKYTELRGWTGT